MAPITSEPFVNCEYLNLRKTFAAPDRVKLERFHRLPELGPAVLFFSGGTAMSAAARVLTEYTHNSIHLMTPFDSGGSSAHLRRAFAMPAIGDIRARLMDLAERKLHGNPEIYDLFAYRLGKDQPQEQLYKELLSICRGSHPYIRAVPYPMRKIIRSNLMYFCRHMPDDLPLAGASIGNLVLTSGYLEQRRHLDPMIFLYSKLVEARGIVRPVVNSNAHLAARLGSGRIICGQHNITGKETPPLTSEIVEIWLTRDMENCRPCQVPIRVKNSELIARSDLICYPFGSFFSSLLANLLPAGTVSAISRAFCNKVFIPNLGHDPELLGHTLQSQTQILLDRLTSEGAAPEQVLDALIIDRDYDYPGGVPWQWLQSRGIKVLAAQLTASPCADRTDPRLVVETLLSLL
jgi:CofD-related protein of GAK system